MKPFRIKYYVTMMFLMRLVIIAAFIIILLFLLPLAVPYIQDAVSFKYIKTALKLEKTLSIYVQGIIPTKIAGADRTRWIFIIAAVLLGVWADNKKVRFSYKLTKLKVKRDYDALKNRMHLSDDAAVLAPIKEQLESIQSGGRSNRNDLLRLFAETKKKLDSAGKDLSFLSVDVVDSTGMKQGEEKAIIEHDFKEYKKFVMDKLTVNGAVKSAWTPDGVMICFPSVDAAVRTARDIITGLAAFNKHVKSMKEDFKVRCGINAGYVYFDDSMTMEEMSDRVIDIAGHMQKQAGPDTICIAKPAIEPMYENDGFVPASKVVDGYEVYVWGNG